MVKKSRLEQLSHKRYARNIILIIIGFFFLILVFFFYGVPLLINFSLFVENFRGSNESSISVNNSNYIPPPVLNLLPSATNSAQITISGSALPNQTVKLYLNGKYIKQIKSDEDKNFVINNVILANGENDIKAKSIESNNKESQYSQNIHIVYKNKSPALEVKYPNDQQIISNSSNINVEGKTDGDAQVTVNGYWAIIDNLGNFSYLLNLQKGDNKIKIVASDEAGNKTEKEVVVKIE